MKILHVTPLYFPAIGGVEALTRLIAEEMSRTGNESIVFTANARSFDDFHSFNLYKGPFLRKEVLDGVSINRFDLNPWLGTFYSQPTDQIPGGWRLQKFFAGQMLDYFQHGPILNGFVDAIGKIKPDMMLATNSYPWTTYAACEAKKKYKIPLVLSPSTHTSDPWAHADTLKEVYQSVDAVIASTEFERAHLIKQGVDVNKIKVVNHGINQKLLEGPKDNSLRKKYNIQENQPVIVYVGRKVKNKGIEELIQAMPLIWQNYPDAYLILAGKLFNNFGAVLNRIIDKIDKKHIKQIININDFKDAETKQIYDAADIFAMPSNIDSFGLVYLEAWTRKLPVIACRNTAQESFIEHGKTGHLVDYGNVESLAAGVKYLLDHKELRIAMGENGHQRVLKEHTVEVYGQRILDVYQGLLRG